MCVRVAIAGRQGGIEKPRGSSTAHGRAKGLEESVAGPSGGGGRERDILEHRGQGQVLTVFITSNQIPLHVYAVFCHNNYYILFFPLHVHCIHLARGMLRMRIPNIIYMSYLILDIHWNCCAQNTLYTFNVSIP